MKASELRIGNWIVNGIGEEFKANGETINNFDAGQSLLGGFKPIPLTEEWKDKLSTPEWFKIKTLGNFFNIDTPKGYIELDYVHQYQNAFNLLSGGEELTIKEL